MSVHEQVYLQEVIVKKPRFFSQQYDFYLDDKLVASLKKKRFGNKAILTTGGRQWYIRFGGFWKGRLEFIDEQTSQVLSTHPVGRNFKTHFTTDSGKKYLFNRKSAWNGAWIWLDEYEQPVMEMKYAHFKSRCCGRVKIYRQLNDDLQLLLLIGWFQLITHQALVAAAA